MAASARAWLRVIVSLRWVAAGGLVAVLAGACTREPEGRFAQHDEPAAAPANALRYAETIAKARRPDDTVRALLELASPAAGELLAVVAVHRPTGDPATGGVAIEVWTFDQRNADGVLEPKGEPEPLLRLDARATSAPALQRLRLRLAAPGADVRRLPGNDAPTPEAALAQLADAAVAVRDLRRDPPARLDALGVVFRGFADGPLFERDALAQAIDRLADDAWQIVRSETISERRVRLHTRGGDVLELQRDGDGWVIAGW